MKRSHHHHHHHQKGTTSSRFPKRRVINAFIYNFFLFTSGLAAGVILNSYIRNASFNLLHLTNFSNIISPSPNSPAPAAAIFPPSPSPTIQPPEATPFQPPIEDDHDQNDVVVHRVGLVEYLKVPDVRHDMEEEELLWRASMVSKLRKYPFKRIPKVAFLFLTKGPIVLHQMWEMFFKGVDQGLYSIYVHSNPFYSEPSDESPIFRGRRIPSKGKVTMMEAERRLLANALLDISNERFILLSESCIPLFNFSTIYTYLINSQQVYVEAYHSTAARNRYTQDMLPEVTVSHWRKGSQWFEIDRELATEVVSDRKYFTKFQRHCKNRPCYVDEHYLPTYFSIMHWRRNSNRSLTWVDWSNGGIHPNRYVRTEVTVQFLEKLRSGGSCLYNGRSTTTCHLFGRKFLTTSLIRLLRYAPRVMHFNP
ncbi:Glycosyltransferase BC10 [Linum perenne]